MPASVKVTVNGEDHAKRLRQGRDFRRARGRQGPVGADPARCLARASPAATRSAVTDGAADPRGHLERLRHRPAQGQERDPVHRRRHVAGAPRRGAPACPRASPRARRSASLPSTTCRTWRWCRPPAATRSSPIRPTRRAPTPPATSRRSTPWGSMPTAPRPVRRSQGRDHHQPGQAQARHGGRHRHQHRDRGRHAGRDGRPHAPARDLRPDRRAVLRGEARRAHGRRRREFPAEGRAGLQAQRRGRLHRAIPRRRLSGRAHRDRDDGRRRRAARRKLLGLFHPGNMDGALDRKFLKGGTVEEISRAAGPDRAGRAPR